VARHHVAEPESADHDDRSDETEPVDHSPREARGPARVGRVEAQLELPRGHEARRPSAHAVERAHDRGEACVGREVLHSFAPQRPLAHRHAPGGRRAHREHHREHREQRAAPHERAEPEDHDRDDTHRHLEQRHAARDQAVRDAPAVEREHRQEVQVVHREQRRDECDEERRAGERAEPDRDAEHARDDDARHGPGEQHEALLVDGSVALGAARRAAHEGNEVHAHVAVAGQAHRGAVAELVEEHGAADGERELPAVEPEPRHEEHRAEREEAERLCARDGAREQRVEPQQRHHLFLDRRRPFRRRRALRLGEDPPPLAIEAVADRVARRAPRAHAERARLGRGNPAPRGPRLVEPRAPARARDREHLVVTEREQRLRGCLATREMRLERCAQIRERNVVRDAARAPHEAIGVSLVERGHERGCGRVPHEALEDPHDRARAVR
jgi:hypothetical protein